MRVKLLLLLLTAALAIVSVFYPWLFIQSKNLFISGWETAGTRYGKPGLLSLLFTLVMVLCIIIPRIWAHRLAIICGALSAGWAVRNFVLLSMCQGGECPQRQAFFYVYLVATLLLLVQVLIHEVPQQKKLSEKKESNL